MKATPLAALHVLVTRPTPQQEELVAAIQAAHGQVLHLPLIEIRALDSQNEPTALINLIRNLNQFDILIFVSSNAVRHGVHWIRKYWPRFPQGIELVAIGPGTARELTVALDQKVLHAEAGSTSEDLLQLPVFTDVNGKRVGIVRGRGGRELLAQTLRDQDAIVEYMEVYTRQPVAYATEDFIRQLQRHQVNVLTVSSGESLQYLAELLGDNKGQMSLLPLLVPSQRVAEQAGSQGFAQIINTGGADVVSYMTALANLVDAASSDCEPGPHSQG